MNIHTERLTIRNVNKNDETAIFKAASCPQIGFMHSNEFTDADKVRQYIDVLEREYLAGKYRTLAVTEKSSDILIGLLTIDKDYIFPRAEISYWIDIPHRNMGYATEAVMAAIGYGFDSLLLNRIQAMYFTDNTASGRVLQKAGMVCEGILRQYVGMGTTFFDCVMCSILRIDYEIMKSRYSR